MSEILEVRTAENFLKDLDIHKFIDEMLAKKDRYVSIFCGQHGTTITVYPLTENWDEDDLK